MSAENVDNISSQDVNWQAAVARTASRGIALYFSRPVRLFRPSKISGWHSLRGLAAGGGTSLSPTFIKSLIRSEGFMVIPKHFIPPMFVNALLGTVLWTTYSESYSQLEPHLNTHPTSAAALSGAIAGGTQAALAAPAENVRLVLEGGSSSGSWSHAWKEVFKGTPGDSSPSRSSPREELREVRSWMREVSSMAGRGWSGWAWGCAKDICGFAAFFSIFEITRRLSIRATKWAHTAMPSGSEGKKEAFHRHFPRTVRAVTLVGGGVLAGLTYESICRPWDVARRTIHISKMSANASDQSPHYFASLTQKLKDDGISSFFREPHAFHDTANHAESTALSLRRAGVLRTLARVGPWGIGFLVFEIFGAGLDTS